MSTTPPPPGTPSSDPLGGPGAPFQGAPQPDPQPGAPQPGRPFMAGMFDSLRRSGVVRTERRVVGGVCGGLAWRLGIDLILVRCVVAVLCLALGLGILAYGVAWALLPEERDGRIHLQQALNGDVSAGFVGAVVCVIGGMSHSDWSLGSGTVFGASGLAGATWGLLWTVGVVGSIIWLVNSRRQQRAGQPPQPARPVADGAWSAPAGHPGTGWGAPQGSPAPESEAAGGPAGGQAWSAPAPAQSSRRPPYGPQPPYGFQRAAAPVVLPPRPPRRPGPGRRMSAVVGGVLLLALAGSALAERYDMLDSLSYSHALLAVGSMTMLLGAGVLVSGLIGRRGGWMSALGVLATLITLPLLAASPYVSHGLSLVIADDVILTPSDEQLSSGDVTLGTFGTGDTVLDLRGLEQRHEGATAHVSLGAGDLRVRVNRDQPVRIRTRVGAGEVRLLGDQRWTVEGTQNKSSIHTTWQGSSDESGAAASISGTRINTDLTPEGAGSDVLTIDVSVGAGDVTVEESSAAWSASSPTASPSTTAGAGPSASPSPSASPTATASTKPSGPSGSPTPTPTH